MQLLTQCGCFTGHD